MLKVDETKVAKKRILLCKKNQQIFGMLMLIT